MTFSETNSFEDSISDNLEKTTVNNHDHDENSLTLRAIVSTKEAGVIIGKGNSIHTLKQKLNYM